MSSPAASTLRHTCRHYPHRDAAILQVLATLDHFRGSLYHELNDFTYDDGRVELLLSITGVIPVPIQRATYQCPITFWLPLDFPNKPPMVFVLPSSTLIVRPGPNIEPSGKVVESAYLDNWARKAEVRLRRALAIAEGGCSLVALVVEELIPMFSRRYPVMARPASKPSTEPKAQTRPSPPPPPPPPSTMPSHSGAPPRPPAPPIKPASPFGNHRSSPSLASSGFVANGAEQQDAAYVSVGSSSPRGLSAPRPPQPPITPLHPTDPRYQSPTPNHPPPPVYPLPNQNPQHARSSSLDQSSPVAAAPVQHPPQPPYSAPFQPFQPPPNQPVASSSGAHPSPPYSSSSPSPAIGHSHTVIPPHYSGPGPNGEGVYNPSLPRVAPISHGVNGTKVVSTGQRSTGPLRPSANFLDDDDDPSRGPGTGTTSYMKGVASTAASGSGTTAAAAPPPPRPTNPALLALRQQLLDKLSHSLHALQIQTHEELQHQNVLRGDLLKGEPAMVDEMQRLQVVKTVCETVEGRYAKVVEEAEKRLGEYQSKGEGPEVDEIVCSSTIVYKQLLDLITEDAALEDTIYHLGRGLNSDVAKIDLDQFLKRVRSLARDQFIRRALINKILLGLAN
ncbi:BZ3500_MvSof-1268-A1-R1_Chr4-2g07199 [Microbotryum saponariae]|uniref:BZ3500_MvSof-1268-A1-R1_Chr4-2g07199 protein n=1 Tax=Microbotryum saponariae TaxID=289078 RepID=A0A2X0LIF7_9BASI|nr:BZ3500_MvSof-1268-A1-R1_Chr4-2g07199 [Microbotryum saponariae]SDA06864.1 BZ3501_MvSof-1269-A2-R1_Chr4-2g06910 [Microbotryum saponariae]